MVTIATRSYPKRRRGLSRVLGRIAACRNKTINRNQRKKTSSKKKKKQAEDPLTKSLSFTSSSSQQESSCCSSSHNGGSATTWDESSSNSNSKASTPCCSPEYAKPIVKVSSDGFPSMPAQQPLLLLGAESEVDTETLLFTAAKEVSSVITDASAASGKNNNESKGDEMLGMEVNVTDQDDDQSQEEEDCLLVSPHEALTGTPQQVVPSSSSPNMIFCEDASSRASSASSTGSYSSQLYPRSHYSNGEESASSILESVDQAKVTKFTKFLQKARQQQHAESQQQQEASSTSGSINDPQSQEAQVQRLPEVNVVMPDIIKLPPTESTSAIEDKVISFLVLFCIVFLLWLLQENLAPVS